MRRTFGLALYYDYCEVVTFITMLVLKKDCPSYVLMNTISTNQLCS